MSNMKVGSKLSLVLTALASPAMLSAQMVQWVTRSADNARSGWNSHETVLTQASIQNRGLVRLTTIPVIGDARGMEAQPLILPNVNTARGLRDVMVLPSMANVVRGVDAHDGSGIWQVSLGVPVNGSKAIDMHQINDHWGCLSTGVIDPDLKRLYQVCWVSQDGSGNPDTARWFMFVLNMADGSQVVAPVMIQGKSGTQDFNAAKRKQRSSLVETNIAGFKTVFGCAGSFVETSDGPAGYCFAFDVATNTVKAMLALTAGKGAGVWMAGQGAAADAQGNLYVITGNGSFDGVSQWGESFLKLKYTPPAGAVGGKLQVVDHWTPWTDLARAGHTGAPEVKLAGTNAASEAVKMPVGGGMNMSLKNARLESKLNERGRPVMLVFPQINQGAWSDEDWGAAGPACLFSIGVCVVTGKDGIAYPIKTANLGGTRLADLLHPKMNCSKLAAPPVWLTMSPGPVDPCPNDPKTLNFFPWGDTAHLHMTPVQFHDPVLNSWTLFAWGENAQLHKWKVDATGKMTYVAEGHEFASVDARNTPPGGMPGGFCAGSSNGNDANSAIVVCTIPYGDANAHVVNGRLLVYDAVHVAPDGFLKVLWDSQQWGIPFVFNKFNPPVIDGGQVYVPNYNGGVEVFGLKP
jgi:hypothetical protein